MKFLKLIKKILECLIFGQVECIVTQIITKFDPYRKYLIIINKRYLNSVTFLNHFRKYVTFLFWPILRKNLHNFLFFIYFQKIEGHTYCIFNVNAFSQLPRLSTNPFCQIMQISLKNENFCLSRRFLDKLQPFLSAVHLLIQLGQFLCKFFYQYGKFIDFSFSVLKIKHYKKIYIIMQKHKNLDISWDTLHKLGLGRKFSSATLFELFFNFCPSTKFHP